jgi:hypothetical protein
MAKVSSGRKSGISRMEENVRKAHAQRVSKRRSQNHGVWLPRAAPAPCGAKRISAYGGERDDAELPYGPQEPATLRETMRFYR